MALLHPQSNMIEMPEAALASLRAAYAQPPRAYHNIEHVEEVLRHVDEVAHGPGWQQPREVSLAACYHDAIYDPARRDNEARSATFAAMEIQRWMPDAGIDASRVEALILLTARHGQLDASDLARDPHPDDARHFLDCDMAILGAEPDVFDAYDQGIAREYRAHVPPWLFRINRRRFLKGLLSRERIFLSDFFHERLDARARANLRRVVTGKR